MSTRLDNIIVDLECKLEVAQKKRDRALATLLRAENRRHDLARKLFRARHRAAQSARVAATVIEGVRAATGGLDPVAVLAPSHAGPHHEPDPASLIDDLQLPDWMVASARKGLQG